jgi:hypothetical protein
MWLDNRRHFVLTCQTMKRRMTPKQALDRAGIDVFV